MGRMQKSAKPYNVHYTIASRQFLYCALKHLRDVISLFDGLICAASNGEFL